MSLLFTTPLTVRFRDLDAMGHVNNAIFFTYFEEGRKAFFSKILPVSNQSLFPFILAHSRCDYLQPIALDTPLLLQLWVKKMSRKRFDLGYQLVNTSDQSLVYARGESVQVCFDYARNQSILMPVELRQQLAAYQRLDTGETDGEA